MTGPEIAGPMQDGAKRSGRFKAGESGNPAGRKPGTGDVAKLRAAIAKHVPAIIEKLAAAALGGDVSAARLLLERTVAPLKASEQTAALAMPEGTLTEQGRSVLLAVAAGQLAPGQGTAMLSALGTLAKLTEADELERRITALEAKHGKVS